MEKKNNCPTHESNYHILNNHCIFVDKINRNYENAKQNCKAKFGGNGKLFEPLTWSENQKAFKLGGSTYLWIGVNDKGTDRTYVYESTGKPISFTPKFYSGYGSRGTSNNCIFYNPPSTESDIVHWVDFDCNSSYYSICENSE